MGTVFRSKMRGALVKKRTDPKSGRQPLGAPRSRVEYRSQAMADEAQQMEEELRFIRKAKEKEKENDAQRKKYAGGANWSRSGTNTTIRQYDKQFMSAVEKRTNSAGSSRSSNSRERAVLDCSSTKPSGVLKVKESRADGCVEKPVPVQLNQPAASRRPKGLFDMPKLPKPASKSSIMAQKEDEHPSLPVSSITEKAIAAEAAQVKACQHADELAKELASLDEVELPMELPPSF